MAETWPIREVAGIAGMNQRILAQQFKIGILKWGPDDIHSQGVGNPSELSRPRIIEAAALRILTKGLGMTASRAVRAIRRFTVDMGCELYPFGITAITFSEKDAVVTNLESDARLSDVSSKACVVLNLNEIVKYVNAELAKLSTKGRQ